VGDRNKCESIIATSCRLFSECLVMCFFTVSLILRSTKSLDAAILAQSFKSFFNL
jgi:hypothetical protein